MTGQFEPAWLQSFIRGAKLRRWLSRPEGPAAIKECKKIFDKLYIPHLATYAEVPDDDESPVESSSSSPPDDLRRLIGHGAITMHARFKHNGVIYARSSTHLGNSLVYFYPDGQTSSPPVPGCVKYIYTNHKGVKFFALHRQLLAPNATPDPYQLYPHFPAKLYSPQLDVKLENVKPEWIMCHFARWTLSPDLAVVLSLSQVSIFHCC
jgi:hypothetical protein